MSWYRTVFNSTVTTSTGTTSTTPTSKRSRHRVRAPRFFLIRGALAAVAAAAVVLGPVALAPAQASPMVPAHPVTLAAAQRTVAASSASVSATRLDALSWAERQAGKWYCWGGTGPSCFDCSGLVQAAFASAGVDLPRTTDGMLGSPRLHRVPAGDRAPGDLAFYGSGHVELVTATGTFGALQPGTEIGYHTPSASWYPTMYFWVS